jgi:hypothetical protein
MDMGTKITNKRGIYGCIFRKPMWHSKITNN